MNNYPRAISSAVNGTFTHLGFRDWRREEGRFGAKLFIRGAQIGNSHVDVFGYMSDDGDAFACQHTYPSVPAYPPPRQPPNYNLPAMAAWLQIKHVTFV